MSGRKQEKLADWTVLIYLAGNNNLTDECVYSLTELRKASRKRNARINVFAQFDPRDIHLPTIRLNIPAKDSRTGRLGDDIVDHMRGRNGTVPGFSEKSRLLRKLGKMIVETGLEARGNGSNEVLLPKPPTPADRQTDS
jgi:hypothetical protein